MRLVSDNKLNCFHVYLIGSLLDSIFAVVNAEVKTLLISKNSVLFHTIYVVHFYFQ